MAGAESGKEDGEFVVAVAVAVVVDVNVGSCSDLISFQLIAN
jgi:hypothetical protein